MRMDFLREIVGELKAKGVSEYKIAQELGTSRQQLNLMLKNKTQTRMSLPLLCRVRQLCAEYDIEPQTWAKMGKKLDGEFLGQEE